LVDFEIGDNEGAEFGFDIAVSGNRTIVGAPFGEGNAYIFSLDSFAEDELSNRIELGDQNVNGSSITFPNLLGFSVAASNELLFVTIDDEFDGSSEIWYDNGEGTIYLTSVFEVVEDIATNGNVLIIGVNGTVYFVDIFTIF